MPAPFPSFHPALPRPLPSVSSTQALCQGVLDARIQELHAFVHTGHPPEASALPDFDRDVTLPLVPYADAKHEDEDAPSYATNEDAERLGVPMALAGVMAAVVGDETRALWWLVELNLACARVAHDAWQHLVRSRAPRLSSFWTHIHELLNALMDESPRVRAVRRSSETGGWALVPVVPREHRNPRQDEAPACDGFAFPMSGAFSEPSHRPALRTGCALCPLLAGLPRTALWATKPDGVAPAESVTLRTTATASPVVIEGHAWMVWPLQGASPDAWVAALQVLCATKMQALLAPDDYRPGLQAALWAVAPPAGATEDDRASDIERAQQPLLALAEPAWWSMRGAFSNIDTARSMLELARRWIPGAAAAPVSAASTFASTHQTAYHEVGRRLLTAWETVQSAPPHDPSRGQLDRRRALAALPLCAQRLVGPFVGVAMPAKMLHADATRDAVPTLAMGRLQLAAFLKALGFCDRELNARWMRVLRHACDPRQTPRYAQRAEREVAAFCAEIARSDLKYVPGCAGMQSRGLCVWPAASGTAAARDIEDSVYSFARFASLTRAPRRPSRAAVDRMPLGLLAQLRCGLISGADACVASPLAFMNGTVTPATPAASSDRPDAPSRPR